MKKFTYLILAGLFTLIFQDTNAQQYLDKKEVIKQAHPGISSQKPSPKKPVKIRQRCSTMEELDKAIKADPTLPEKWRIEGEKQYQLYLDRVHSGARENGTQDNPIIVPIVFHLVDDAATIASISDRDIYEQVEILNRDYAGKKLDQYTAVIPPLAAARVGKINIKFVLARRDPSGNLTSGIERRANATPDHIAIKATSTGGLDAWDPTKYLNVWVGTFSGTDDGLLGIATFPFTTGQGAQGVVIGLVTLPYASHLSRSYMPNFSEGATLSHEIGHYFYLIHTFGDQATCNNNDFQLVSGWPLPTGDGPEGDDTPAEKGTASSSFIFGNPSMNYNDGCSPEPFGILYGTYMNYFDDRALFMFSNGERKRVEDCLNAYRSGYLTSNGATPPSAVTDAYLVNVSPRGYLERRAIAVSNTPFQAIVRNYGTITLTSVTLNVAIDGGAATPTVFTISLAPGSDTTLNLGAITGAVGNHSYRVFTSAPNGGTDNFLTNDTLYSFTSIHGGTTTLPLTESFTSGTFPPAGWLVVNPNGTAANTWVRSSTSGNAALGSAFFDNYNIEEVGTLDELITPAIDLGTSPGALLTFSVASAVLSATDVSVWDGLEVYVSGDGGKTYKLVLKKTGPALSTLTTTAEFTATPAQPSRWRTETIDLSSYVVPGQKMIVKFRNVDAYGNNTYLDDISITGTSGVGTNDAQISAIAYPVTGSTIACTPIKPVVTIKNLGTNALTGATINISLNGTFVYSQAWTGLLASGASASVALNTPLNIATNGSNTVKVYTTLPNGQLDADVTNDTATSVFTKVVPVALPATNNFETAFLPTGWSASNPDNDDLEWVRINPAGGAAGGSAYAANIDNYNFEFENTADDIITPVLNTSSLLANDSVLVTFDLAYKNFPSPTNSDTLKVLVSTDCGVTWTTLWSKGGPDLATAGSTSSDYSAPAAADWKNQRISIGTSIFGAGQVQVAFRNINEYGNEVWLDNINVIVKPRKDMQALAIVRPNATECTSSVTPSLTVRNNGGEVVTSFKTGYILNGGAPFIQGNNVSLATAATTTVTFPSITLPSGINTIKLFVADPITASPGPDGTISNDTITRTFSVPPTFPNVIEGFEGSTFVPANWTLINANNNATWVRKAPGKNSAFSAFFDNYNNDVTGQVDMLQTPPVNTAGADGVRITFDVAHKDYPGQLDRLRVLASTNCAVSFTPVYSKAGSVATNPASPLATAGSSDQDYTTPLQTDWRKDTVILNSSFTGGNLIVQFENRNDYGNNIFIDNINIAPIFKRDLEVLSVTPSILCTSAFAPVATIRNSGTETVTAFKVSYTIGTGAAVTTTVTGVSIAPNATTTVALTAGTLVTGANNIKVYTTEPTTTSGTGDQYLQNDTITRVASVVGSVSAPNTSIVETFEGGFLPTGWALTNPDNSLTWQKASVGKNSSGSAYIRNFIYYANGQKDALYTPVLNFNGVDSILLTFDLSATTRDLANAAPLGLDTLEVLVTKDCGNTFTSIYKKWGEQLQTINDVNYPQTVEFAPNAPHLWRTESINLTSYIPDGPLQLVFRNTTNNQNDVYIDNVNLRTRTLPSTLKSNGYVITPNPFGEQFNLWFVQVPTDLRYITVLNAAGQRMWAQEYSNGSGTNVININLSGKAAGLYFINLGYSDKSKDKQIRVIKSN